MIRTCTLHTGLICAVCFLLGAAAPGNAESALFTLRDLYPLSAIHYSSTPRSARLIPPETFQMEAVALWGNTNAIRDAYIVDAETRDFRLVLRKRWRAEREIHIELPIVYRGHGVLDPFINDWHDFWGLPEGHRDRVAENTYTISGTTDDGQPFALTESGTGPGNAVLGLRQQLIQNVDDSLVVTLDSRLSLPTARQTLGHSGLDFFTGLQSTFSFQSAALHAGTGVLFIGDTEVSRIEYARWRSESFIAAEYFFSSWTLFSSLSVTSKIVENIPDHPDYSGFIDVGAAFPCTEFLRAHVAIREELNSGNGALDIGLMAGLRWSFSR